jgi:hypothetical protein
LALFFLGVGSRKCGVVGLGTRGIGEVLFRSDWGDRFIYDPIIASAPCILVRNGGCWNGVVHSKAVRVEKSSKIFVIAKSANGI